MINTIFLDMDGVICNFVEGFFARFDIHEHEGVPVWEYVDGWGRFVHVLNELTDLNYNEHQTWQDIASWGEGFWAELNWTDEGQALFELCDNSNAEVILLTTPSGDPSSPAGKLKWIKSNLPKHMKRRYVFTPRKELLARPNAILIDDSIENIDRFEKANGQVFLWPRPWNDPEWKTRTPLEDLTKILGG